MSHSFFLRQLHTSMFILAITSLLTSRSFSAQTYDGPAELPRVTVSSSMADTPAPGSIISVNAGGDFQSALDNANCGDIIELEAGATFTGQFTLQAKYCDVKHWIWIRTSANDNQLPAEGQRATPCYAGVASLEGRPQYNCKKATNVMAKVQMDKIGNGPFQIAPAANFYRLIGLEVTRANNTPGPASLVSTQGTADHIVFDRSWFHGAAQDETYNGISLSGMTNAAIVDSYFNDFHCIGACTDAHAIHGGTGETQDGPFKIQDNFLEAAGEDIMFGGGPSKYSPSDIEILGNHFWKPWQWMPGNKPFIGTPQGKPFIVKNHLELKNAIRVLVDGNLLENIWGGFSQTGFAILLTPKNQRMQGGRNGCPTCEVTDVTVRYVHIAHAAGGIQMATSLSAGGGAATWGTRFSIHDVVVDDLSSNYVGPGIAYSLGNSWPKNALNTVTINHTTAFPDPSKSMMFIGNVVKTAHMSGFVFTNNLMPTADHPIWNTGNTHSCAVKDVPLTTMKNCFTSYQFANNGLIAPPPAFPPSTWPSNNMFPQTVGDVDFTDYNNGNGGNYQLLSHSPYKNAGTDGKDLGADIVGLNQELANVE